MPSGVYLNLDMKPEHRKAIRSLGDGTTVNKWLKSLLHDIADFWHKQIFPSHFTPGAETRYGYEPRTEAYKKKKRRLGRGQGRYVANIFSGKSARWMTSTGTISSTSKTATVHMPAPAYFRNPFIGTIRFASGKSMTIKRQPDKVAEVTRVNDADYRRIEKFASSRLQDLINRSMSAVKAA